LASIEEDIAIIFEIT